MNVSPCIILIYIYICVGLPREYVSTPLVPPPNEPHVDMNATIISRSEGALEAQDIDDEIYRLKPEPVFDGKPHDLIVGECNNATNLLHEETIVVNNDGTSRIGGNIRVNVEAPVNITCFIVLDNAGNSSGAVPSYLEGGLGYNYVVFDLNTIYGYGLNFLVQIYGNQLSND